MEAKNMDKTTITMEMTTTITTNLIPWKKKNPMKKNIIQHNSIHKNLTIFFHFKKYSKNWTPSLRKSTLLSTWIRDGASFYLKSSSGTKTTSESSITTRWRSIKKESASNQVFFLCKVVKMWKTCAWSAAHKISCWSKMFVSMPSAMNAG